MPLQMPSLLMSCGRRKKQKHCLPQELEAGDCTDSREARHSPWGLILCGRVGKHTDELAPELVVSIQVGSDCKEWHTDGRSGYERALCSDEIEHCISKGLTQRVERTNGIMRQQTGQSASTTK